MKWKFIGVLSLALALTAIQVKAQDTGTTGTTGTDTLTTEKQKVSYAIGVQVAKGLKNDKVDVDVPTLMKGLQDTLAGDKVLMSDEEIGATLNAFQREMAQKQAEDNQKAGAAFLAENAKKDGVVTQPSGLQYKVVKASDGKKPTDADTVICQYRGTLIDGTEFDNTSAQGKPATLQVKDLIPGIREALKLMTVGSTYQFVIPAELAYGASGAGNTIGPNATLIFEISLVGIQDQATAPAPAGAAPAPAAPGANQTKP